VTWDRKDVERQPAAAHGPGAWMPRRRPPPLEASEDEEEREESGALEEDPSASPVFFAPMHETIPGRPPLLPLAVRRDMAQLGLADDATWARKRQWYTRGIPSL